MITLHIDEHISLPTGSALPAGSALLEQAALATLRYCTGPEDADLAIVLTDDEQLRQLNAQFLGIDATTDVLSFPSDEIDPDTNCRYLGDILISVARAQAQSEAAGHALKDELQLLIVHGTLHLLGHDHAEPDEQARMWAAQNAVLEGLGCPRTVKRDA